ERQQLAQKTVDQLHGIAVLRPQITVSVPGGVRLRIVQKRVRRFVGFHIRQRFAVDGTSDNGVIYFVPSLRVFGAKLRGVAGDINLEFTFARIERGFQSTIVDDIESTRGITSRRIRRVQRGRSLLVRKVAVPFP